RPYIATSAPVLISLMIIFSIVVQGFSQNFLVNISYAFLIGNLLVVILYLIEYFRVGGGINFFNFKFDRLTVKVLRSSFAIIILVFFNQVFFFSKNYFASYFGEGA